ncbi:MAG TPA: hypothetical protein VFI95_18025 [Terriglobales bacterium]|jgi:hypothetical protein|nr:hypothetical protein [Terriglobales bacterium]
MKTVLSALWLLSLILSQEAGRHPRVIRGAKVYRAVRDPRDLVRFAKSLGLNTLFVGDQLAASLPFRQECQKAGLQYFLIIRIFNDPEAAADDATMISVDREGRQGRRGDDVMISPAREDFRRIKRERIRAAIERLKPDGVTLDYFRYFIYWEGVDPKTGPLNFPAFSFDRASVEDFVRATGLPLKPDLPPGTQEVPRALIDRIWNHHREAWYRWRVERLVEDAQEFTSFIRQQFPELPIVLHAVPWTRDEFGGAREKIVGQDLRRLAPFFDYVSPMEYSALTRRGPGWVERLNRNLVAEVPAAKLLPSVEVGPDGPQFPLMSLEDYESDLIAARKASAGLVLYHLELLLDDPARQDITKRLIGGR